MAASYSKSIRPIEQTTIRFDLDAVLRTQRSKEKQEAKELLLKYRTALEKAIQNIREFSVWEIPNTSGGAVQRILSFEFNDVNSATWKTERRILQRYCLA